MTSTTPRAPEESPWYPRHASDRADELIDELDEALCRQLYDALRPMQYEEWLDWMYSHEAAIAEHDGITASQRKRRLHARSGSVDSARLQHACVFLALWHARMAWHHGHLPSRAQPGHRPDEQRRMLLASLASLRNAPVRDLWPFEWHLEDEPWHPPFEDYRDHREQA